MRESWPSEPTFESPELEGVVSATAPPPWPDGTRFAFTILDDTDDATVENVRPIYELLRNLGLRTTKTVWPVACPEGSKNFFVGKTLADEAYLGFVKELQAWGFEIAFHGATMESSRRERTERALEVFASEFGGPPAIHCNHAHNRENLYWGSERYRTRTIAALARLAESRGVRRPYEGHRPGSPYFWGDLCRARVRYVRSFAFRRLDVATLFPGRPYRRSDTEWVNAWFNTADAPNLKAFNGLVTPEAVRRLEAHGGYCILSTHLGKGFVKGGVIDRQARETLEHIASLNGWFVPTSELLDHLGMPDEPPSRAGMAMLELRHVLDRLTNR